MNTTPDKPLNTGPEGELADAASADEAPAKAARRRRTPKAELPVESATAAQGSPAPAPVETAETVPAPAKRSRRKPVQEAATQSEAGAASGDATPPAARPEPESEASPAAATEPAPLVAAPDASRAQAEGGDVAQAGTEGGEEGGAARGERRRRGRRDRKRGPRPDTVAATEVSQRADGDDASDEAAERPPRPEPQDVGELFAQVVAGGFDDEVQEPAAEEVPAKRVLLPDPDAPKLHKVLAQAGIGSRRDLEQMIADGRVTVNGEPAHTGQRISFGDQVKVEGKPVKFRIAPPPARIVAYHKPVGEVVTNDDPQQRPTVFRRLPRLQQGKWQSVGRLDINTEGLLLFTNSGELANQLMHPRFGIEREYAVRVLGTLDEDQREELLDGVEVDGQEASFKSIEDGGGEGANHWYRVVITEGRNREVRKLFDAIGLTVSRLIRIRYGTVVLPRGLKRGVWVDLDPDDVRAIRRLAGGGEAHPGGGKPQPGRGNERGPNGPRGRGEERGPRRDRAPELDGDGMPIGPIPNPLEQTFDKRFVQKPRGFGGGGGGGFGNPGAPGGDRKKGNAPRQPDPLQTTVGYIGADAFHRKGSRGGGNRGGGGGGFGGGGGGGGGFGGGNRGGGGGRRGR